MVPPEGCSQADIQGHKIQMRVLRKSCDRAPSRVFRGACHASTTAAGRSARFGDRVPRSPCGAAGSGRTAARKGMPSCGGNARASSSTTATLGRKPFDQRRTAAGAFDPAIPELAPRPCAVAEADDALSTGRRGKRERHTCGLRRAGTSSQDLPMNRLHSQIGSTPGSIRLMLLSHGTCQGSCADVRVRCFTRVRSCRQLPGSR